MLAWCEETSAVHGSGEPMETKLHRIAEKARKEPDFKFTSLYHLMNEELLRECFKRLRKDAATGIDEMTKDTETPPLRRDGGASWRMKNGEHCRQSINHIKQLTYAGAPADNLG